MPNPYGTHPDPVGTTSALPWSCGATPFSYFQFILKDGVSVLNKVLCVKVPELLPFQLENNGYFFKPRHSAMLAQCVINILLPGLGRRSSSALKPQLLTCLSAKKNSEKMDCLCETSSWTLNL